MIAECNPLNVAFFREVKPHVWLPWMLIVGDKQEYRVCFECKSMEIRDK